MNPIPVLTIEDVAMLDAVLEDFLKKTESELTVVIDRGGNVISQSGDMNAMDVTVIAALAAGSFAATQELARRIGELEFNAVGVVRFYATSAAQRIAAILKSLRRTGHGLAFTPADISAAPVFADR